MTANHDLAKLILRKQLDVVFQLGVSDVHIDAPDAAADRSGFAAEVLLIEARNRRRFGEPIALVDRDAETGLECLEHDERQR